MMNDEQKRLRYAKMAALLASLAVALVAARASADIVAYNIPGTSAGMLIQGRTVVNPGGTVTLRHAKYGSLVFGLKDIKIYKVPTSAERAARELNRALATKNAERVYQAAVYALRRGLLDEFYSAVDKTLDLDPQHAEARHVVELRGLMQRPIAKSQTLEDELREFTIKRDLKAIWSDHFLVMHDTPTPPPGERSKSRAQQRVELLEHVYQTFLLTFHARGVDLDVPTERMKVVLFNNYSDYRAFAVRLSPGLSSASGFWDPDSNTSVFFAHATHDAYKQLKKMSDELNEFSDEAIRRRLGVDISDLVRFSRTLKVLLQIAEEDEDISVVSHEATHQMAGNTGLFPRHVLVPKWAHEGLATWFECPADASWSGVGAVNEERIDWYRAWANDPQRSSIDRVVGDQVFSFSKTFGDQLYAYSQAWALTHFLLEEHFEKTVQVYRALGEMPPDIVLAPDVLTEIFDRVFEGQRASLDFEWKSYMRELKTSTEEILSSDD